jgi:hypothetical protein
MTPHKALNNLRKTMTLDSIRKELKKRKVPVSVATLWRIMDNPNHQTSFRVASAILAMAEKN